MAGFKEAAVHVTVAIAIVPSVAFIRGVVIPVRGAAQVGTHRFACIREHQKTVPKLAKQTGEDKGGTLLCLKKKKKKMISGPYGGISEGQACVLDNFTANS